MPLAGKVKLKNFLLVVGIICFILCIVVGALFFVPCMAGSLFVANVEAPREQSEIISPVVVVSPPEEVVAAVKDEQGHHSIVLGYEGKDIGTAKLKDVSQGRPFKVNVYQDEGKGSVNRAKVDLDRDEKWDEKWTFEAGRVVRQDAPGDDENYTQTWIFVNGAWAAEGAEVPEVPKEEASPAAAQPAYHAVVFGYQGKDIGTTKLKDVTKGKPFKVNVYQDAGSSTVNRAKVDLDRDEKWDEKWTFGTDKVTRQVAPTDDENYTEVWVWNGLDWTPEG
ncbi:MAG: hypothetical protein HN348_19545 [Proteobacteria bacterium]|jgi:hypothetical protein|nr:hypothetical protein [Pseudomonadota bacterium]